jgi:hypothetical protein
MHWMHGTGIFVHFLFRHSVSAQLLLEIKQQLRGLLTGRKRNKLSAISILIPPLPYNTPLPNRPDTPNRTNNPNRN